MTADTRTPDIAALPNDLRDALGMIAIGQDGWVNLRLKRRLLKLGLIEPDEELVYGPGNSPIDRIPVKITRYFVPTPIHIAWARWCSTQENTDGDH